MKALSLTFLCSAAALLIVGCSSSSTDSSELATVLDAAADREGIPKNECREACVAAALAVFDECTDGGDDREHCFGEAIHAFFNCAKECPPPSCEERCEAKGRAHYMACKDDGGDEDTCAAEGREVAAMCKEANCEEPPTCKEECEDHAREVYDRCVEDGAGGTGGTGGIQPMPTANGTGGMGGAGGSDGVDKRCAERARQALADCLEENCGDPEPASCEDACGTIAEHVYDACMEKLDDEDRCAKIARGIQWLCNKHCEGYECPCHDDCDDGDSDSDSDSDSDKDKECNGDGKGHYHSNGKGHGQGKHCVD